MQKVPGQRRSAGPVRLALGMVVLASMLSACTKAEEPAVKKPAVLKPQEQPMAITSGIQIPDGPFIHAQGPGPEGKGLPISGFPYTGLNSDYTTIGNFDGFTALAYVTGEATGSDGKKYLLETDMRAFKGTYKDANGMERTGTFAFV
jgi:hypothetical protein